MKRSSHTEYCRPEKERRLQLSDSQPRKNEEYKVDDWGMLNRFLYLGTKYSYNALDKHPERENAECIDRLIYPKDPKERGNGIKVVQHLSKLSQQGRTLRQNYLIFALAICARSNDIDTKREAYKELYKICRIPTHLFLFAHYCKQESLQSGSKSKGWGRAHRRAMINWYKEKSKEPLVLARHLTKYKSRKIHDVDDKKGEVWSHKKILQMAHPKVDDKLMKVVIKYVLFGFEKAKELASSTEMDIESIKDFVSFIEGTEKAKRCHDENELTALIKEFKLEREHIPTQMMQSKIVCEAIIKNMKTEAKIRNISLMASKGLCGVGSEGERLIIKILESGEALQQNRVHPFRILVALLSYKKGEKEVHVRRKEEKRKRQKRVLKWNENENISKKLDSAFYLSFQDVEPFPEKKRFLLAISLSEDMARPCQGCPSVSCENAAAAMMLLTATATNGKCIAVVFSSNFVTKIKIKKENTLKDVIKEIDKHKDRDAKDNESDARHKDKYAEHFPPISWALNKKKKFDVFVVFSDNKTREGNTLSEEMKKYRQKMIPDAITIVVAMLANDTTLADKQDPFVFNIAGFDIKVARFIQLIASKNIDLFHLEKQFNKSLRLY